MLGAERWGMGKQRDRERLGIWIGQEDFLKVFPLRGVRHWKRWPGLLWCLSKIFKVQLDMTLSNLM